MKNFLLLGLSVLLLGASNVFAGNDQQRFTSSGVEVYKVTQEGAVLTASGVTVTPGLAVVVHDFIDLPAATSLIPNTVILSTTALFDSATTYTNNTIVAQPTPPRTIEFLITGGSGTAVIKGTDTFNNDITEVVSIDSGVVTYSFTPWSWISSATVHISTVDVISASTTITMTSSEGIGLYGNIDFSKDVFHVTYGYTKVSTVTGNAGNNTVIISSDATDGARDWRVWAFIRRTLTSIAP